jgi:Fe-S oxidoreductase
MELSLIFDAPIEDVSLLALEKGIDAKGNGGYLYHAPCHDSLDGGAVKMLKDNVAIDVQSVSHCCSEGGTLSLSRPDISNAMLKRKREEIKGLLAEPSSETELLTNCPSCIQGLGRNAHLGIKPVHIAVKLAVLAGGSDWEEELKQMVKNAEVITF